MVSRFEAEGFPEPMAQTSHSAEKAAGRGCICLKLSLICLTQGLAGELQA